MSTDNENLPFIAPLLPPDWDATALDALGAFPRSLQFVLNGWKEAGIATRGANVLGTMAHHPPLAKAFMTYNAHVASASTLPVRIRELVILRTSWLRHSEYEYAQHVLLGRRAGLTDAEIERTQQGGAAPGWDPVEADFLRAVDQLHGRSAGIERATWLRLSRTYSPVQLLDLIFLVGCYDVLALAINSIGMAMEPDPALPRLDATSRQRLLASKPDDSHSITDA
jgi:4-carboxymuconolactone decarboxylase